MSSVGSNCLNSSIRCLRIRVPGKAMEPWLVVRRPSVEKDPGSLGYARDDTKSQTTRPRVLFLCLLFLCHSERSEETRIPTLATAHPANIGRRAPRESEQSDGAMVEGARLRIAPGILRCAQNDTERSCAFFQLAQLFTQ